jgi:hypothetical protein
VGSEHHSYKYILIPGYDHAPLPPNRKDVYNKLAITKQEVLEAIVSQQQQQHAPLAKPELQRPGWQCVKDKGGPTLVLSLHCSGYDFESRVSTSMSQV